MSRNEPPGAGASPETVALDQWRGLALLFVVIAHTFHETRKMDGLGRVGVNLFFFISGILVFRSLAGSRAGAPGATIRSFWYRRLRRLYPALLAYVLVLVPAAYWLQNLPGLPHCSDFVSTLKAAPLALLYCINFKQGVPMCLGHLWSLACEMQFYFVAPLIFFLPGTGARRRTLVYGVILFSLMALGIAEPLFQSDPMSMQRYYFQFAVWPMMAGFFCECHRGWLTRWPEKWCRFAYRAGLAVCTLGLPLMFLGTKMKLPVIALGALLLVPCLLSYGRGWPFPAAFGRGFRWLGERTYSIYLWQQPLTICFFLPVAWWPAGALASIFVGALWFRWFERPFLSMSRKKNILAA